jgi:hypothetical protein
MKRILTALSASTALSCAMLAPSAGASVAPGHGPGATASQVRHRTYAPIRTTPSAIRTAPSPIRAAFSPIRATSSPIRATSLGVGVSAVKVVSLGASFSPPTVALTPGEPLIIIVSHSVRAHLDIASGGSLVYDGRDGDVYLFFARKPGMSVVSARVGPRCATKVCPQWRTAPDLTVTTY